MKNDKKTQQPDRRANRTILGRTLFLMVLLGVVAFVPLMARLYDIQIANHEYYQERAIDQQTDDLPVSANRGYIYDTQGNPLAMSATVHNIILSPADLKMVQTAYAESAQRAAAKGEKMSYPEPTNQFIAENLADILDLDAEKILTRLAKTNSRYEVIKWRVEQEESDAVRQFITDNHLSNSIVVQATTKRYYPYGSLAAQVIGWVNPNDENRGAYGLEALYEEELAGQTGRVVTAKDGTGREMLYRFEDYYDATDGNNLTITLDATIQYYCARILEKGISTYDVQDGGFAIAMDPNTGAILAWANSPTYDLNKPWTVENPQLLASLETVVDDPATEADERKQAEINTLYEQWRNKAITDTYEPGSTFKSVVLAAALEEGVVNENTTFNCSGSVTVADRIIRCSKRSGHGTQTLAQAVANSCNPAFIAIGQRLGAEKFYDYLEDYGFLQKTGIDMQGEMDTSSLIWPREDFTGPYGITSLATASFGQRFSVTPIQMITAAASVINGGHLMQPYVLDSITDQEGNVLKHTEPTEVRQVVSEETSAKCRDILEQVVLPGGTGHNAYVAGYRIAGKTGSSETLEKDHTIVSFLGFAPANDPQVIILLAYDNPKPVSPGSNYTAGGYYISGGNMAAPMAGELLANILDYLGVEKQYTQDELSGADTLVPSLVGMTPDAATAALKQVNLDVRTVGDGETVTGQIPAQGVSIPGGSKVVLYLGDETPTDLVQVPNVSGKSPEQTRAALESAGLYLKASGVTEYTAGNTVATSQSIAPGSQVERGTVVEVHFIQNSTSGAGSGL